MNPSVTEIMTNADVLVLSQWVGDYPRLATADEYGSYADMRTLVEATYPGVLLDAATIDVPTITVTIQCSNPGGIYWLGCYLIEHDGSFAGANFFGEGGAFLDAAPDEWLTHTFTLTAGTDYNKADVEACIAAGTFAVVAEHAQTTNTGPFEDISFRYSQILVTIGGAERPLPLRQKQRDDGLGRSVVRARSTHSVQRSLRQRGYR